MEQCATTLDASGGTVGFAAMMTAQDMAQLLGCSGRTVYRLADSGRIPPPIRLGGLCRWNRAVIDAWLAQGCPECHKALRR